MQRDGVYMERALQLAARGLGRTRPNPVVGAVIVDGDQIVGEGWHHRAGEAHAEVVALEQAGSRARGATLYVTLEPCSHQGRTPPCAPRLVEAGLARVVVGLVDPNPKVSGGGIAILERAGLEVVLADHDTQRRCAESNRFFLRWIASGRPYLTLKYALTLDGKIATREGHARWISGPRARRWVHRQRDQHDAVLVGIGTVLADDPLLTARGPGGRTPLKVVVDSRGRMPATARLLQDAPGGVVVATTPAGAERLAGLAVDTIVSQGADGRVDVASMAEQLGHRGVLSVLVEAGGELNASLLEADLVDQVAVFLAPILVGGASAPGPIGGSGVASMEAAWRLREVQWRAVGGDLFIEGYLRLPWEGVGGSSRSA